MYVTLFEMWFLFYMDLQNQYMLHCNGFHSSGSTRNNSHIKNHSLTNIIVFKHTINANRKSLIKINIKDITQGKRSTENITTF